MYMHAESRPSWTSRTPLAEELVCLEGSSLAGSYAGMLVIALCLGALLNRLCGSRVAIVEPTAGVTRDRVSVPARMSGPWGERWVERWGAFSAGIGVVHMDGTPHGSQ